jgi:Ion channel/Pentapeptide repeats (8 copies)
MTEANHVFVLRKGADAWNAWREANPSVCLDLRGANLSGVNLGGAFLRGANLGAANLNRANFSKAILDASDLSGADLSGANLNGANLSLSNLSNTELTGVRWQLHAMRGCYLGVRGLDSCFGNALFKRAAADQDFLDTLEAHLEGSRRMALFRAWGLIDYGRSMLRVATMSFGLAAVYGVVYRIFPNVLDYKDSANSWFTPFYFSIVTYTTLGFGDVRPATLVGEIIVSEVILGYTTLGLLLSVLAQSIARRS